MQSLRNFIVKTDAAFSDTIKTESGLELYVNQKISRERSSNRVLKVIEVPVNVSDNEIQPGYEVMVDPTILYMQNYTGRGDQDNPFMIDRNNGLYKVEPKMIVLYRENEDAEWKAYGENTLVEFIKETTEKLSGGLFIGNETKEKVKALYPTKVMEDSGISSGDEIIIKKGTEVSFWIEGKEYHWIENKDVLAKVG